MAKQAQTVKKFSDFKPKPPQPPARAKIPAGLGRKAGPVKLRKAAKRQYGRDSPPCGGNPAGN